MHALTQEGEPSDGMSWMCTKWGKQPSPASYMEELDLWFWQDWEQEKWPDGKGSLESPQ